MNKSPTFATCPATSHDIASRPPHKSSRSQKMEAGDLSEPMLTEGIERASSRERSSSAVVAEAHAHAAIETEFLTHLAAAETTQKGWRVSPAGEITFRSRADLAALVADFTHQRDSLTRLALHVEEALLHNEKGAPKLIGRTLPDSLGHGASLRTTIFNLVSTMLGSGMLSLPWVLACLGMGGGLIVMVLVPLLSERTIWWCAKAAEVPPSPLDPELEQLATLPAVVERSLGKRVALLGALTMVSLNFGVSVSYCVVIKGLLPSQLHALANLLLGTDLTEEPLGPTASLMAVSALVLVPLTSLKTTEQMKLASIASVILVYVFVGIMCAAGVLTLMDHDKYLDDDGTSVVHAFEPGGSSSVWFRGGLVEWLKAVPVVGFSYLCHQNVPTFYAEMFYRPNSPELRRLSPRFTRVTPESLSRWHDKPHKFLAASRVSMAVATVLYMLTAWGGYAAFGVQAQPNVLLNFKPGPHQPLSMPTIAGIRAAFVGTMVFTFPTMSHGLRTSLHTLAFEDQPETAMYRWLEALGLVAAIAGVAAAVDNLGLVFQLVGSTCGTLLMFIMPASFKLFGRTEEEVDVTLGEVVERGFAWLAMGFGVAVLVGSNAVTFLGK